MTPLQLQMMLHYYAIAEPYAANEPEHANSTAVRMQRQALVDLDLIVKDNESPSYFRATERGRAYVLALCDMKLPVCQWVIPQ